MFLETNINFQYSLYNRFNYSLTVTGETSPFTMREGIKTNDIDMLTTHEEADIIMVHQP